jgi:hypothetical protein
MGGLFVAEHSGALLHWTRTIISNRLGPVGGDLTIDRIELHWWHPGVSLHDISLGPDGRDITLRSLRANLRWDSPWPRLSSIEVANGHIRLSPALVNGLRGLGGEPADLLADGSGEQKAMRLPTVHVRNLRVDVAMPDWGEVPGGRMDLLFDASTRNGSGPPRLTGRFAPTLARGELSADAPDPGTIYLRGAVEGNSLRVRAAGRALNLNGDLIPAGSGLEGLRAWQPQISLDLDGTALIPLRGGAPDAHLRLVLSNGSAFVPHTGDSLENLQAQWALRIEGAPPGEGAGDGEAQTTWDLKGTVGGSWRGADLSGALLGGTAAGEEYDLRLWLRGSDFPLGDEVPAMMKRDVGIQQVWDALELRGRGDLLVGLRLPRAPAGEAEEETASPRPEFLVVADLAGDAAITYHGWEHNGLRDTGFPAPLEAVRGKVFYGISPASGRRAVLGLVGLSGFLEGQPVRLRGSSFSPHRAAPPWHVAELFIDVHIDRLLVGPTLRRALEGLSGVIPPESLWDRYGFNGGSLAADVIIRRGPRSPRTAVSVDLDLVETGLTWTILPVPMQRVSGKVEVRSNGKPAEDGGSWGVRFDASGRLGFSGEALHLAGRIVENRAGLRESIEVRIPHLPLAGGDVAVVRETVPAVDSGLAALSPRGHAFVDYRRSRPAPDAPVTTVVQITPLSPVQLRPERFQMITRDVGGRILVSVIEPVDGKGGSSEVLLEPLLGIWEDDVPVAIRARIPGEGRARLDIFGAGLDPTRRSLLGSLGEAMRDQGGSAPDLSALALEGRLDFTAHLEYSVDDQQNADTVFRFHLRDNSFATGEGFALSHLRGTLTLEEGRLRGRSLKGMLGSTPVELRNASFEPSASGYRFDTDLTALDLPLDEDHLRFFLDEETRAGLLGELALVGTIDIPEGHVTLSATPATGRRLVFSGIVLPRDTFLDLGVSLQVDSARLDVENLTLEGGRVRALAMVEDLVGTVADQTLKGASAILTYLEPHLTLENFDGRLEGGRLRSLGGNEDRGGPFFALDLTEPYSFQVTADLRGATVAGFTRNLFPSDFADRGDVDCQLRLVGEIGDLTGIRGSGRVELMHSNLWSIPVFRVLFSQLGQESTATFHNMGARFTISDGRVDMSGILVKSDLLKLVGSGVLDFDGRLHHDFEVRYSLVDKLGPLNRILYAIQNSLLSVAVRGDLARPEVVMRGILSTILGMGRNGGPALPLPEVTPLPPRF